MHLYVQVHLKEVNRNFPFALSGPFKWGKWHLASLDLNGTEPWLASGVNTCVIQPVSHRPCVLWVQPSTPSLTHRALLFWQDLAEPNKADSGLFVRPPAFAVCVCVCDRSISHEWIGGGERRVPGGPSGDGEMKYGRDWARRTQGCVCTVTVGMCTCANERESRPSAGSLGFDR